MVYLQFVDIHRLKQDFIKENRELIPKEYLPYAVAWEVSAAHFVDLFLDYLERRGLEISFKQPL